jgi:hypothetical protein
MKFKPGAKRSRSGHAEEALGIKPKTDQPV